MVSEKNWYPFLIILFTPLKTTFYKYVCTFLNRWWLQCIADQGLQVEGRHWITVTMNMITSGIPSLLHIYYLSNHKIETISLMCKVITASHFLIKWTTITDLPMKNSNLRWMSWCVYLEYFSHWICYKNSLSNLYFTILMNFYHDYFSLLH